MHAGMHVISLQVHALIYISVGLQLLTHLQFNLTSKLCVYFVTDEDQNFLSCYRTPCYWERWRTSRRRPRRKLAAQMHP